MSLIKTPAICGQAICGQAVCASKEFDFNLKNVSAADYGENPKINLATGRMIYENADISIGGGTYAIGISHVYNSEQNVNADFCGNGWKLNAHRKLVCVNGRYKYVDAKGEINTFVLFDRANSRYYNEVDAEQVLTVPATGMPFISDGAGNKIYFNTDGNVCQTVSAFNSNVIKVFEYDSYGRLSKIYDKRLNFAGRIRTYLSFEYENNLLHSITAYDNYSKIASMLIYKYEGTNLTRIDLSAYDSNGVNTTDKTIKEFYYDSDGRLTAAVDTEFRSACTFDYAYGKISKVEYGVIGENYSYDRLPLSDGYFVSKGKSVYTYNHDNYNSVTDITNEDGIRTTFYLDTNNRIVSQFERVENENLATLKKENGKALILGDYSVRPAEQKINGKNTYRITREMSLEFSSYYDISHYEDTDNKYFDCSFWLRHNEDTERLKLKFEYMLGANSRTEYVWINGRAKNSWQKVSVTLSLKYNDIIFKSKTLKAVKISLYGASGYQANSFMISDLYFMPAPKIDFCIKRSDDELPLSFSIIDQIDYKTIDGSNVQIFNNSNSELYFTENDILKSFINKFGRSATVNGKKVFDIICKDGTRRISDVCGFFADQKAPANNEISGAISGAISSVFPIAYTYTIMPNNKVSTRQDYRFETDRFKIATTNTYKENGIGGGESDKDRSTTNSIEYNYKGQKLSETDEYGLKTEYTYNRYGQLIKTQKRASDNTIGEIAEVKYDENEENIKSYSLGFGSNEFKYSSPFALNTEITENSFNGSTYENTDNKKKISHGEFKDRITTTAQYNGTQKVHQNDITYENGRIRTVTNGSVGYGVMHNFVIDWVEYTRITDDEEITVQVNDKQSGTNKIYTSTYYGASNDSVSTQTDKYNKPIVIRADNAEETLFGYNDDNGSRAAAQITAIRDGFSGNAINYNFDKYNNMYGWSCGGLTVEQITGADTIYTFSKNEKYRTQIQYDSDKIMSPRISATVVMSDFDGDASEDFGEMEEFRREYEYDNLGWLTNKKYAKDGGYLGDRINKSDKISYITIGNSNTNIPLSTTYQLDASRKTGGSRFGYSIDRKETYSYDQKGNIKRVEISSESKVLSGVVKTNETQTKRYEYDSLNRLIMEDDSRFGLKSYIYGADGRIETILDETKLKEFKYDSRKQLKSCDGTTYNYDDLGNRISKVKDGITDKYSYTRGSLLSGIHKSGEDSSGESSYIADSKYTYNMDGVRVKKELDGITIKYYLDGNKILGEDWDFKGQPAIKLRYFYDIDGLCGIRYNDKNYEVVRNAYGDVVMLIRDALVVAQYFYDAWGNCEVIKNKDDDIGNINPFRWKGHYYDVESGLYYANGSYYDPEVGLHVDAAPISSMIENAYDDFTLDINGIMCDNILAYLPNAYSILTTIELSANPGYNPDHDKGWWKLAWQAIVNWLCSVAQWLESIDPVIKEWIGLALFVAACALTIFTYGATLQAAAVMLSMAISMLVGIAISAAGSAISAAVNGGNIGDAVMQGIADAMF